MRLGRSSSPQTLPHFSSAGQCRNGLADMGETMNALYSAKKRKLLILAMLVLLVGLVVYVVLRAIPGLGTLVGWLVVLLALGAPWEWGRKLLRHSPPISTAGLQLA